MKTKKLIIASLLTFFLFNCSNDSESDLINVIDVPDDTENPGDVSVAYNNEISSIMQSACTSCHGSPPTNGAPFSLINFTQVNQRASGILNRMSLQNGSPGAMPPSGRLPQATIDLIQQWINDGKPEN